MDYSKRKHLGGSLSTGQLMRLASQVSQSPTELLSLTVADRTWDFDAPALRTLPSSIVLAQPKSGSRLLGGQVVTNSGTMLPLRRRIDESDTQQGLPRSSSKEAARHDRGVSSCIKRENFSQEQATAKFDTSQSSIRKGAKVVPQSLDIDLVESPCARKHTMDMIEADFQEEVTAMESQMANIGKSLQMNRFSKEDQEARANEEREAEKKRRREADLRKARLKEKAARDPHRKIQAKLDIKRRFEMDTLDQAGIPTTDVTFQGRGGLGYEKMKLVDVQALRSKCHGLSDGIHSVPKLIEMQQRKDAVQHQSSTACTPGASLMMSRSMPNLVPEAMRSQESGKHDGMHASCRDRYQRTTDRQWPTSKRSAAYVENFPKGP